MTFYNNINSCVINNGITSDYFTLTARTTSEERAIRSSCRNPALTVGQYIAIKGITIGKDEANILQCADDTTAVLSDIISARILFKLFDNFKKLSGLAINPC